MKKSFIISLSFLLFIFTISSCKPTVSSNTPENEQTQTTTNETDTRTPKPNDNPVNTISYNLKKGSELNYILKDMIMSYRCHIFTQSFSKPADPIAIDYLDVDNKNVMVWPDTKTNTIYYFAEGVTSSDINLKLVLNEDSSSIFCNTEFGEIDVSKFDTSNVINMSAMFADTYVTNLNLSHFDTSKVTNMSNMFGHCWNLTNLDITNFDTSKVTNMSYMFSYCQSLETLDVSKFKTSNVKDIYNMFEGCSSLEVLDVSGFDTSKVFSMYRMFAGCSSLTELDASTFDTSNVSDTSYMFSSCSKITSLDLSNFSFSHFGQTQLTPMNALDISFMFQNCSELQTIYCNSSMPVLNAYNYPIFSDSTFNGCTKLKGAKGTVYTNSANLNYAHIDLGTASPGYFTSKNMIIRTLKTGSDINAIFTQLGAKTLAVSFEMSNVAPEVNAQVYYLDLEDKVQAWYDSISKTIFYYDAEAVAQNKKLKLIMNKDSSYMFAGCELLKNIDLSNFDSIIVEDIRFLFAACKALEVLDISTFDTRVLINMSYMFYDCENLQTIYASSNFIPINNNPDSLVFWGCVKLEGGAGTAYKERTEDFKYARIDGAGNQSGYFTLKQ